MFDTIFKGSQRYYTLVGVLFVLMVMGIGIFAWQFTYGLGLTGMSRDVPWGFYIAQFTFLVGVAASAVMVVLPYYLHDYKAFGKITILGEFLAIPAVLLCMTFVVADMGMPIRLGNIFLHPTPNSVMFWDVCVLMGYLVLNIIIARVTYEAERKGVAPPRWIKPVILLSIPWAVSIHTVTAFLYCGIGGRHFWLTAILAPRFLASAFASGPALLILLVFLLRKYTRFDAGDKAIKKLGQIVAYAMVINVFFILLELFTAFYSDLPSHTIHFEFLFAGLPGAEWVSRAMWLSVALAVLAVLLLVVPKYRSNLDLLPWTCAAVIVSIYIDKGIGMVSAGLTPNPLDEVVPYVPTLPELGLSVGIYAGGALALTLLYKVALAIREKPAK